MNIPSDYVEGYEKARLVDPEMADAYVRHLHLGDPEADSMMEELAAIPARDARRFIEAGMDRDHEVLKDAPPLLVKFFDSLDNPPEWLDTAAFVPGIRMFHRNSRVVLVGFVGGVLVEGFATNISKSFFITGRLRDHGVRRLKQNNRHMLESFLPGGLDRQGDGLKLSVRVRIIHAQLRQLLKESDDWDAAAWGLPLSAAHLGYSITAFSARLLKHMKGLGATFDEEERASFMAVWRYIGYLMGIPETILFKNEDEALRVFRIGGMVEPPISPESIAMANSLIASAPYVAGIPDRDARAKLTYYAYKLSRALIGDPLADELKYPPVRSLWVLLHFRNLGRLRRIMGKSFPKLVNNPYTHFTGLLEVSAYDEDGISYRLPDHVYAEESSFY
ncbi:MAG: oxygenase MpaB family protein [bacterium]|nr:oxygenase MpaB family protein [bacterium]